MSTDSVQDKRTLPIFIHSVIDDMTSITPNGMRVYMHLARRAGANNQAWPSYQSIGDHCFRYAENAATRKRNASKAVQELIEHGLLAKEQRVRQDGGQTSNMYTLLNPPGVAIARGVASSQGGGAIATKGTPIEDTPLNDPTASDTKKVFKILEDTWTTVSPFQTEKHMKLVNTYGFAEWKAGFLRAPISARSNQSYVEKCILSAIEEGAGSPETKPQPSTLRMDKRTGYYDFPSYADYKAALEAYPEIEGQSTVKGTKV